MGCRQWQAFTHRSLGEGQRAVKDTFAFPFRPAYALPAERRVTKPRFPSPDQGRRGTTGGSHAPLWTGAREPGVVAWYSVMAR
jgi:hypothetical protein